MKKLLIALALVPTLANAKVYCTGKFANGSGEEKLEILGDMHNITVERKGYFPDGKLATEHTYYANAIKADYAIDLKTGDTTDLIGIWYVSVEPAPALFYMQFNPVNVRFSTITGTGGTTFTGKCHRTSEKE